MSSVENTANDWDEQIRLALEEFSSTESLKNRRRKRSLKIACGTVEKSRNLPVAELKHITSELDKFESPSKILWTLKLLKRLTKESRALPEEQTIIDEYIVDILDSLSLTPTEGKIHTEYHAYVRAHLIALKAYKINAETFTENTRPLPFPIQIETRLEIRAATKRVKSPEEEDLPDTLLEIEPLPDDANEIKPVREVDVDTLVQGTTLEKMKAYLQTFIKANPHAGELIRLYLPHTDVLGRYENQAKLKTANEELKNAQEQSENEEVIAGLIAKIKSIRKTDEYRKSENKRLTKEFKTIVSYLCRKILTLIQCPYTDAQLETMLKDWKYKENSTTIPDEMVEKYLRTYTVRLEDNKAIFNRSEFDDAIRSLVEEITEGKLTGAVRFETIDRLIREKISPDDIKFIHKKPQSETTDSIDRKIRNKAMRLRAESESIYADEHKKDLYFLIQEYFQFSPPPLPPDAKMMRELVFNYIVQTLITSDTE